MTATTTKQIELKVAGMTCAMCTKAVESSLLDKTGVVLAQVNLGNETATVQFDPAQVNLTEMVGAVKDAGYEVIHDTTTLKIGGMTCAMCVKAIQSALGELDGVIEAEVTNDPPPEATKREYESGWM